MKWETNEECIIEEQLNTIAELKKQVEELEGKEITNEQKTWICVFLIMASIILGGIFIDRYFEFQIQKLKIESSK